MQKDELQQAWQAANQSVRQAEDRLAAAWAAFSAGEAGPPDAALMDDVSRLRRECDQLLMSLLERFNAGRGPSPQAPEDNTAHP